MDHVTYPRRAAVPPIAIPYYVLPDHVYDSHGLSGFPSRKNIRWPSPSSVTPDLEAEIRQILSTATSLVQSWLFFGLIEECHKLLLPPAMIFDRNKYITGDDSNRRLTTAPLSQLLLNWEAWDRPLDNHERLPNLHKVKENLELAIGYGTGLMELAVHVHELDWISKIECSAVEELTLCIYCLCEALGKPGMIYKVNFSTLNTSEPAILSERFLESGFCPKEIKLLMYQTFTVCYAASALDRHVDATSHDKCTAESCIYEHIDENLYVRPHAHDCDNLQCVDVTSRSAGENDISAILLKGGVPLIRLSENAPGCEVLTTTDHEQKTRTYVAISHVWSDGLGNVTENALRICQLRRIQSLVDELYPALPPRVAFWMDTLCVPREKEAKKKAIKRMKFCYEAADKVLVLDSVIMRNALATEPCEAFLSIATSRWRFRLWTLQEAIFAKDLYFQAQDKQFNLNSFDEHYNSKFPALPGETTTSAIGSQVMRTPVSRMHMEPLLSDLTTEISGLYPLVHGLSDDWRILERISRTLAYRTTTNAEDEAICLASLLGNDPSPAVGLEHEDAMITVFGSFDRIPLGLLFSSRPRIPRPGWMWLPRTLLWYGGTNSFAGDGESFRADRNGAHVSLPGAKIDLRDVDNITDVGKWYFKTVYHGESVVFSVDSDVDRLSVLDLKSCKGPIYVITRHLIGNGRRNSFAMLTVQDDISEDGFARLRWLANLVVAMESLCPPWFVQDAPMVKIVEQYGPSQQWCIG